MAIPETDRQGDAEIAELLKDLSRTRTRPRKAVGHRRKKRALTQPARQRQVVCSTALDFAHRTLSAVCEWTFCSFLCLAVCPSALLTYFWSGPARFRLSWILFPSWLMPLSGHDHSGRRCGCAARGVDRIARVRFSVSGLSAAASQPFPVGIYSAMLSPGWDPQCAPMGSHLKESAPSFTVSCQ